MGRATQNACRGVDANEDPKRLVAAGRPVHDDRLTPRTRVIELPVQSTTLDSSRSNHRSEPLGEARHLAAMSREVGQSRDRRVASNGGDGPVVIVEVQPIR